MNLIRNKYIYPLSILFYSFLMLTMVFARSFIGVYIFGYRIGELLIPLSMVIFILFSFQKVTDFFLLDIDKNQLLIQKLMIGSFIIISFFNGSSFFNPYTYKSSSYIWTIGFLFLGLLFLNVLEKSNLLIMGLYLLLPLIYLMGTAFYPNFMIEFFNEYSDKFEFVKASDLMLAYIIVNLSILKYRKITYLNVSYLVISSNVFFPLFLFNSRGSFISALIFFLLLLFSMRKFLIKNKLKTLLLLFVGYIFFYGSVLHVYGEFTFIKLNDASNPEIVTEQVGEIIKKKETTEVFFSFYIEDGRLYSDDSTTNWRLDIWQDVITDMNEKNIVFTGYGYSDIIPVMLDPSAPGRLGRDGLNENVHNYFVNIFARGGLLQLLLFIIFFIKIVITSKKVNKNYGVLFLLIPVFLNSSFDTNLEGVQYPLLFYAFLGNLYFVKRNSDSLI